MAYVEMGSLKNTIDNLNGQNVSYSFFVELSYLSLFIKLRFFSSIELYKDNLFTIICLNVIMFEYLWRG